MAFTFTTEPWTSILRAKLPYKKFLSMSEKGQHKKAAALLRDAYTDQSLLPTYQEVGKWLNLPPLPLNSEAMSDRYHYHLRIACIHVKEHNFLPQVRHLDALSNEPFLPIDIYLDRLRSAHNIGSIIRTTEAFRLGEIHFSEMTPYIYHKKVKSAAMGTDTLVTCHEKTPLSKLRRPLIALETHDEATSIYDYTFPSECTLLIGNEEYGLSHQSLEAADITLQIPLIGSKNSLNVACAFAIAAGKLRHDTIAKP